MYGLSKKKRKKMKIIKTLHDIQNNIEQREMLDKLNNISETSNDRLIHLCNHLQTEYPGTKECQDMYCA